MTTHLDSSQYGITKTIWLNYFDNPVETTMGDVAQETGFSRATVRHAVRDLVGADLLRAHASRAGLYEHDYYDDPTTAFEEAFSMTKFNPADSRGDVDNPDTVDLESTGTNCRCGCGEQVQSKKAEYRPGHDARHAGQVGRAVAASPVASDQAALLATLPSTALRFKAQAVANKVALKAQAKAERKANRALKAGTPAKSVAKPVQNLRAKVGRWVKVGHMDGAEFVTTDAKGKEVRTSKFTLVD